MSTRRLFSSDPAGARMRGRYARGSSRRAALVCAGVIGCAVKIWSMMIIFLGKMASLVACFPAKLHMWFLVGTSIHGLSWLHFDRMLQ